MTQRAPDPRLKLPAGERLRVNEIYLSLQGESTHVGKPCTFVRLTGCQMRCVWCDSEHSFYEGDWRSVDEVLQRVTELGAATVEVTGGEPLLQPGATTLLRRLCDAGYEVLLETGGGVAIDAVDPRVHRILDIKCPGSEEADNNLWSNLESLRADDEVKFVVADRADFDWALDILRQYRLPERCTLLMSAVESGESEITSTALADWILESKEPIRLQVQLHKVLWGDRRGV